MAFLIKSLPIFILVSSALAQLEDYHGYEAIYKHEPHQHLEHHHQHEDYDLDYHAHPKYAFDYSVKDPHTGDNKEHWETRDGDKVKGSYTVLETDGTKRVVEYEADDKNGFNAIVHKIGAPKEELKFEEHKFEGNKFEGHKFEAPKFENYHHEYQHFDEGFVPIVGYEH